MANTFPSPNPSQPLSQQPTSSATALPPTVPEEDNFMRLLLGYYNTYVRQYFWLYPTAILLFAAAAFIYLRTQVPLYRSTCQLHVSNADLRVTELRGIVDPYNAAGASFINTQIRLMQSPEILNRAYELTGGLEGDSSKCSEPEIAQVPNTTLVNLSITSPYPEAAAKLANTIAEVYMTSVLQRRVSISITGVDLLRDQLDDLQKSRDKAMAELLKFKEQHGIFDLEQTYTTLLSQLTELNKHCIEAEIQDVELTATLQTIEEHRADAVILMPFLLPEGATNLGSLKSLYLSHEMRLPELLTQYNEAHQAVQTHRKVGDMIIAAEEKEIDISIQGLELRRKRSQQRVIRLNAQIAEIRERLNSLDRIGGDYKIREAACAALDDTCRMLVNRINEIKIADATTKIENYAIFIVEPAISASQPFYPVPKKVFSTALVLALALAGGIAFILVSVNNKVTHIEMVSAQFGNTLANFGSVPLFTEDGHQLLKSSGEDPIDEAFRDIRTSLNLSALTRSSRVLAISSATPSEGKTFIAANLARSFARDKKRTLLIDMDLRKPRLHKLLQDFLPPDSGKRGISNVLVGDCALSDIVIPIKELGLDAALAGPIPPNPNELLGGGGLKKLLKDAQEKYDLVIIDTAPLLVVSDTLIIASHGVPIILATRLYTVTKPIIRHLSERLKQVNISLAGLIANNADVPKNAYYSYKDGYGYGYGHGHGYGYGYGYGKTKERQKR